MDIGNFTDNSNYSDKNLLISNFENKKQDSIQKIEKFQNVLSKELCDKVNSKMRELDISAQNCEKLIFYINGMAHADIRTAEHCMRVALLSEKIGREIETDSKALFYSGLLHDIGKILVPSGVLQKEQKFELIDMELIREHPLNTFRIIQKDFGFSAEVGVRHHRYQPNAYPKVLPESRLPFSDETKKKIEYYSKVLTVADFFDAAVSRKNDKFGKNDILRVDEAVKKMLEQNIGEREVVEKISKTDIFEEHLQLIK
jgi:putative nucleotidyltransferase with HDIG domain